MNQTVVAIIIGLAAATGGVFLMDTLRGDQTGASAGVTDLSAIESRLRSIEERLPAAGAGGGAQLATSGIPTAVLDRLEAIERAIRDAPGLAGGAAEGGAAPAGSLARIDERLASIEDKLGTDSPLAAPKRRSKKRISLAEVASELELSGAQEDELGQIYERFHGKMYKFAAGPDGDPEDVKRDVAAAAKDPSKAMGLVGKYMPNIIGNIGGMMQAQTERQEAIDKLLGPEKAQRLRSDFDVKEDNILGLGGARTEFRMGGR